MAEWKLQCPMCASDCYLRGNPAPGSNNVKAKRGVYMCTNAACRGVKNGKKSWTFTDPPNPAVPLAATPNYAIGACLTCRTLVPFLTMNEVKTCGCSQTTQQRTVSRTSFLTSHTHIQTDTRTTTIQLSPVTPNILDHPYIS